MFPSGHIGLLHRTGQCGGLSMSIRSCLHTVKKHAVENVLDFIPMHETFCWAGAACVCVGGRGECMEDESRRLLVA